MSALDDLELLQIEMDLLWGADGGPELVIASARAGQRARVGQGVPVDRKPLVGPRHETADTQHILRPHPGQQSRHGNHMLAAELFGHELAGIDDDHSAALDEHSAAGGIVAR